MASSKTLKRVKVRWVDPTSFNGWLSLADVEDFKFSVKLTEGFLLEDTEERVTIAHTTSDNDALGVLYLPRGCVLTIDEVGEVEIEDKS